MKLFKWLKGRNDSAQYWKFPFLSFRIGNYAMDGYILKYPEPTVLGWHRDEVENGIHWRMNVTLKGDSTFWIQKYENLISTKRIVNLFRSDIHPHSLEVRSSTIKLSIGFFKFKK